MRHLSIVLLVFTAVTIASVLLDIPLFREAIAFIYLSIVPGFVILKVFRFKKIGFLRGFLFSVGLSLIFVMLAGWLVNDGYAILGFSQPLSIVPLLTAISGSTLVIWLIGYKGGSSQEDSLAEHLNVKVKIVLPIVVFSIILPVLSIVGALLVDIPILLLLCALISVLCIVSVALNVPAFRAFSPILIFSISITLLCMSLWLSKYIIGSDSNIEFYVFRLVQTHGFWTPFGSLAETFAPIVTSYNSMMSITLLPSIYSALMNSQGDLVFKVLYMFIFSLVPLVLYETYKREIGRASAFLSVLFFTFTSVAFFGEPTSLNRQIVGEFFLLLAILVIIDKAMPAVKKRFLFLIFGAGLVVSHYSLAYFLLFFVTVLFIVPKITTKFKETIDSVSLILLFVFSFSYYAFASNALSLLYQSLQRLVAQLASGQIFAQAGTATALFGLPDVFTMASWINLVVSGLSYLFIITGILAITFGFKGFQLSDKFRLLTILAAVILGISLVAPSFAALLNFTRFYGITLLFLSPCFVLGGIALITPLKRQFTGNSKFSRSINSVRNPSRAVLFIIAIVLGAYFLSQSGFVNYVLDARVHSLALDYNRMQEDPRTITMFYSTYIPTQDVSAANWIFKNMNHSSLIYADFISGNNVLLSHGLVSGERWLDIEPSIVNNTRPGVFFYLGSLNTKHDIIPTSNITLRSQDIISFLNECNQIYSNRESSILGTTE